MRKLKVNVGTQNRVAAALALLTLLSGCPDPNTYGTPRTLAPGDVQLVVGIQGVAGTANGTTAVAPGLPSLGVRIGLADRLDLGIRESNFSGLSSDLKFNFLRGRFDMALDPAVQGYYYDVSGLTTPIAAAQFHLPLLLGINFDEDTALVLTPGFVATAATTVVAGTGADAQQTAALSSGLGARLGLGLHIRTGRRLAWQPELTVFHEFNDVSSWVYVLGIGMNVGAQPDTSDIGGDD
jgi:hypothetical protein